MVLAKHLHAVLVAAFALLPTAGDVQCDVSDREAIASEGASPFWGPERLSAFGAEVAYSTVASNARGDTVAVWTRVTKRRFLKLGPGSIESVVEARFRPADGDWGPTLRLSPEATFVIFPRAVVDASGQAHVVWLQQTTEDYDVETARRDPRTGQWSAPLAITGGHTHRVFQEQPDLAVDGDGNALVVYRDLDPRAFFASSFARFDGVRWSAPEAIAPGGDPATDGALAMGPNGDAWFAYTETDGGSALRLRKRPAGATSVWGAAEDAPAITGVGAFASRPALTLAKDGSATIVWVEPRAAGQAEIVRAIARSPSGVWSTKTDLSTDLMGTTSSFLGGPSPRVASDDAGNVVAAWVQIAGDASRIQTSTRDASGTWSATETLSGDDARVGVPLLAVAADGSALVSWIAPSPFRQLLRHASRSPSRLPWSAPRDSFLLGYAFNPAVTTDGHGHMTTIWLRTADALGFFGAVETASVAFLP